MSTAISSSAPESRSDQIPPALDFTSELPPFRAVNGSVIETVRPYNLCDHAGPFLFRLSRDPIRYMQPNFIRLTGMMRILKDGATAIPAAAKVTVIDGYGQALINKVEVHVNNKIVSDGGGGNYHHKAMIRSLINYDKAAFSTHLRSSGFSAFKDGTPDLADDDSIVKGAKTYEDFTKWKHLTKNQNRFASSAWK